MQKRPIKGKTTAASEWSCGARLLVRSLEAQGVKYVFGIPGAKIDRVFEELADSTIKLVVCRHEQNAAFIAGGIGRLTGRAGVALTTSGPGCTNLVTGMATANSEGDPIVAMSGAVALGDRLKQAHQSLDAVSLTRPVTKFAAEVVSPTAISESLCNAFRAAESGRPGAAFLSLPSDVMNAETSATVLAPAKTVALGSAPMKAIKETARMLEAAKRPVLLMGMLASHPENAAAVRALLARHPMAAVSTFQGTGVLSREELGCFGGRVGLFSNQPADLLLDAADVVVSVGFDPIEYDPALWNREHTHRVVHIDQVAADYDAAYRPAVELMGAIAATLKALTRELKPRRSTGHEALLQEIAREREALAATAAALPAAPVHPLRVVNEFQQILDGDVTLCLDMGSFHIWMARHLTSFRPRQLLVSNGQQTLGVALPWAIAANLVRPSDRIISVSGDGGFLFSAMEMETAVRLRCNIAHIVWIDGSYDMVRFQAVHKYGRAAGVDFGPVDLISYAQAFGAKGFMVETADQFSVVLRDALDMSGVVVIGVRVDYRDNHRLMESLHPGVFH
jgi:acetolactate synthase-1/2/3 large subunit